MTISRITRRPNSPGSGFTLLELLLVVTMMALLTAIALPRFSRLTERTRLEEGAQALASIVRFGRMESVRRGLKVRLEFGENGSRFRLNVQDPATTYRGSFTEFEDDFLDSWQTLPARVRVASVLGREGRGAPRQIVFHPNGFASATELDLRDARGKSISVKLDALPSEVRVEKPKGPELEAEMAE